MCNNRREHRACRAGVRTPTHMPSPPISTRDTSHDSPSYRNPAGHQTAAANPSPSASVSHHVLLPPHPLRKPPARPHAKTTRPWMQPTSPSADEDVTSFLDVTLPATSPIGGSCHQRSTALAQGLRRTGQVRMWLAGMRRSSAHPPCAKARHGAFWRLLAFVSPMVQDRVCDVP